MKTALDTNVIAALWSREPGSSSVASQLGAAAEQGGIVISAPVYAELLSHPNTSEAFLDEFLMRTNVQVDFDLSEQVWKEAARAFASYAARRRKSRAGHPRRLLVDCLVGAHAWLCADRLYTLDRGIYSTSFPKLNVL
jgi:predicted nucleic acid-binding protein